MSALGLSADLEEFGWMLPTAGARHELDAGFRRLHQTRLAAMLFKRRWRLLIHWRRQNILPPQHAIVASTAKWGANDGTPTDVIKIRCFPHSLPPLREEIAIWRSFLAAEINAILFGTD